MNSDIRLQMNFYSNTKIKKLKRTLGSDAVLSLIYLWLYVADNRPHGELRGMDKEDIAVAAQWEGDPNAFVDTLVYMKFLNKKGKLYLIHDWESNNPYAFNSPERKKKAQQAANCRWAKNKEKELCNEHNLASVEHMPLTLPIYNPPISPQEDERFEKFWKAYPRKVAKDAARRAWKKIKEPVLTLGLILQALEWQSVSDDWTKNNGEYIPHPSTYLNQGRWKDEPQTAGRSSLQPVPAMRGVI